MNKLGFKIVDQSVSEIAPMLERALAELRPIEVGLYFGDPDALASLSRHLHGAEIPVTVHIDHRRYSIFSLERYEGLVEQLDQAQALGAKRVVDHISKYPMTRRLDRRDELRQRLAERVARVAAECGSRGLDLHIENTFHDLDFHQWLFDWFDDDGLGTHFCFDIGHARVWSTRTFADWVDFMAKLERGGRRLHMHCHMNSGLADQHLSYPNAERRGVGGRDAFTGALDDIQCLAHLIERFPTADKIFEVPPEEALENLDWVLDRLSNQLSMRG